MTDAGGQNRNQLKRKLEIVWDALRVLGIKLVVVEFLGSGDSGQIDVAIRRAGMTCGVWSKTLPDAGQPIVLLQDVIIELSDEIHRRMKFPTGTTTTAATARWSGLSRTLIRRGFTMLIGSLSRSTWRWWSTRPASSSTTGSATARGRE